MSETGARARAAAGAKLDLREHRSGERLERLDLLAGPGSRLSYFGGLSHTEIAARLGVPLGTIKGRMRLALQKLAGQLGEQAAVLHETEADPARSRLVSGLTTPRTNRQR